VNEEHERTFRVGVIGAGMAGILTAIRLKEIGIDFAVYEKAERVGGTWRENTYPGLACDVPSVVYSYSFEHNPEWSRRYASGPEVQAYFASVAERYDILPFIQFGAEIVRCQWDGARWEIETNAGHRETFDAVIAATGVLHHPNVPHFEGIESFRGHVFHSARWDHDVPLDGQRVGVVGTGSTAVQITCALAERAQHFSLFQRTAQWVMTEPNPQIDEDTKEAFRRDPHLMAERQASLAKKFREYLIPGFLDVESERMHEIEERCRRDLEEGVRDPDLRERLRPSYKAGCKRLVVSPNFYETMQRANVSLVTSPIDRIEPEGLRTSDGHLHELDVLVLATGFDAQKFVRPMQVIGRGGLGLDEAWADGPVAYLSIGVPEFPNFFMLNGPNGPVGNLSLIEVAEAQLGYVMQLVEMLRAGDRKEFSVTEEAMRTFEVERIAAASSTVWATGCNSWYLDKHGVPATWTFTYDRFVDEMSKPNLADFE
jgi:cation diffusion facilitator CzcD-associated flavoprotein CzcO